MALSRSDADRQWLDGIVRRGPDTRRDDCHGIEELPLPSAGAAAHLFMLHCDDAPYMEEHSGPDRPF